MLEPVYYSVERCCTFTTCIVSLKSKREKRKEEEKKITAHGILQGQRGMCSRRNDIVRSTAVHGLLFLVAMIYCCVLLLVHRKAVQRVLFLELRNVLFEHPSRQNDAKVYSTRHHGYPTAQEDILSMALSKYCTWCTFSSRKGFCTVQGSQQQRMLFNIYGSK